PMVKMHGNMMELKNPTERIDHIAVCPLVNTEVVTRSPAMTAANASSLLGLIFWSNPEPIKRPNMAPIQYTEMYFAASPSAARYRRAASEIFTGERNPPMLSNARLFAMELPMATSPPT